MIYGLWYVLGMLTVLALPYVARNQEMLKFLSTCVG
jgi:hypothetical protein